MAQDNLPTESRWYYDHARGAYYHVNQGPTGHGHDLTLTTATGTTFTLTPDAWTRDYAHECERIARPRDGRALLTPGRVFWDADFQDYGIITDAALDEDGDGGYTAYYDGSGGVEADVRGFIEGALGDRIRPVRWEYTDEDALMAALVDIASAYGANMRGVRRAASVDALDRCETVHDVLSAVFVGRKLAEGGGSFLQD